MPWMTFEVESVSTRRLATVCEDCIKITFSGDGSFPRILSQVPCEGFECTQEELESMLEADGWRVLGWMSPTTAILW